MKNYLITGGCGFIGQHLAKELLKSNCKVDLIDLPNKKSSIISNNLRFLKGDVSKNEIFKKLKKKYDIAFHLAAQTSSRLSEINNKNDINNNILGSLNFCEWAKKTRPGRVVFTSSMAVYGDSKKKFKEDNICNPKSIYGMSKLYSEKLFQRLMMQKIKVTIFRLFNIYGPGQDLNNLFQGMFSIYLAQALKKNKIDVTGSLNRYRDFVYIDDTVKGLLINPRYKKNWLMNLGTGKKTYVKQVIKIIKGIISNQKIKISVHKGTFEDTWGSYADISKIKSEGWRPKFNLEKGAKLTINKINEKKKFS